ncbi:MAG: LacI family transcriptional regulator [Spirochaetales bacterium]|nr:LacI family transcriptional regulator [Spirochaetales bacterium]
MGDTGAMKRRATIKDVASVAGVSIGTVSRYLNGLNIREANRVAVESAITNLRFRADRFARSMKTGKSQSIGLLVSGFDSFTTDVLATMVRIFQELGYALVTFHHDGNGELFDVAMGEMLDRNLDAIAMCGMQCDASMLQDLLSQEKPLVVFNNEIPGFDLERVLVNDEEASFSAVSYLLDMNHRAIGILTGDLETSTAQNRLNGYERAFQSRSIPIHDGLVHQGYWSVESGYLGTKALMENSQPPTALLTSSYKLGIGAMKALQELNLSIPHDVSLISFDDPSLFSITNPPITTVAQPSEAVGSHVASFLKDRITGVYSGPPREMRLDCRLILRQSVQSL